MIMEVYRFTRGRLSSSPLGPNSLRSRPPNQQLEPSTVAASKLASALAAQPPRRQVSFVYDVI